MPPKTQQNQTKPSQTSQAQCSQAQRNGEHNQDDSGKNPGQEEGFQPAFSEEEQYKERQNAANQSLEAKKKARYYIRAAAGAGDSKERQKLLKQALNKEVEAESFGKLAKWLNTGALQGFAAGSIPAASLGALTGTLVGGVTSLITGGLGAGVGYLKGPAYSVGGVAASGLKKVTGDWLQWNPDSSDEQKQAVEDMCGQIDEQDMPDDDELEMFSTGEWSAGDGIKQGLNEMHDGRGKPTQSRSSYAASWVPGQQALESVPGYKKLQGGGKDQRAYTNKMAQEGRAPKREAAARPKAQGPTGQPEAQNEKMQLRSQQFDTAAQGINQAQKRNTQSQARPQQAGRTGNTTAAGGKPSSASSATKQKPGASSQSPASKPKGKPRKLEVRSQ